MDGCIIGRNWEKSPISAVKFMKNSTWSQISGVEVILTLTGPKLAIKILIIEL